MTESSGFSGISARLLSHCGRREVENRLEIQRSRLGGAGFHGTCCPIQAQGLDELPAVPERAAHERREPGEAQAPFREVAQIAEDQMRQEPYPHLPLYGVLAVADEVVDLACLLEFLEEGLYPPPVAVYLGRRPRGPLEVVRQEHHRLHLPLYLDDRRDAAQRAPVLRRARLLRGHDDLVRKYLRLLLACRRRRLHEPPHYLHLHVPLLARHEPDAALVKPVHEAEVRVGSVRDGDVAALQVRGELCRAHGIMVRGVLHDGEGREPVAEAERQVELGGGLLAAVPRPVEAVHGQLDRGRVDGEHGRLDPGAVAPVRAAPETRGDAGEVVVHPPVEVLRHRGRPRRVGVGEGVPPRHSYAHRRPERPVRGRYVADRVERLGLRHLAVEHRRDMALRGERPALHLVRLRGFRDELVRNDVDYLTDNRVYCLRCFRVGVFHIRVGYTEPARKATLNRIPWVTNGMLVVLNTLMPSVMANGWQSRQIGQMRIRLLIVSLMTKMRLGKFYEQWRKE